MVTKATAPPRPILLAGVLSLLAGVVFASCSDGATTPPTPTPPTPPATPTPTTVAVTPASASMDALGATVRLTAAVRDQNGQAMSGVTVTWASSATAIATVDASGLVTAVANGAAAITATAGSVSGAAAVTVAQVAASVSMTPESATLAIGDTVRIVAAVVDANDHPLAGTSVEWSSSDESVATVSSSGLVTAVAAGTANVRATAGTVSGTAAVTVESGGGSAGADRAALVALYNSAGGPSWIQSDGWNTDRPLSEWYGVVVDPRTNRVEAVDLYYNQLSGSLPPELGNMRGLVHLGLGENQLTGSIPPELARLANLWILHLEGNALTGSIPPELGSLTRLESLLLQENNLTGGVPAALGSMSRLRRLELSNNEGLTGTLPAGLTGLSLHTFMATGTGLCAPRESSFERWLNTITRQRIALCGAAMAYLVQAAQSRTHPVPLVAGRRALLRVFVTATRPTSQGIPPVRARFFVNGTERHVANIPAQSTSIPTIVDEGDLAKSANAEIPGSVVVHGLEMVIDVDPNGTVSPNPGFARRIPAQGRMPVDVRQMPLFQLTAIPFLWAESPDSAVIATVNGMASDPQGNHTLALTRILLPIGDLNVTAHAPVVSTSNSAFDLLGQTDVIQILEEEAGGGGGYYLGMMSANLAPGADGVAHVPGRSAFARPDPWVIAHELGHNMNLQHTSCGDPAGQDLAYPHAEGRQGAWGYDFRNQSTVDPREHYDLMGYCDPLWVSDYHFSIALRYRLASEGAAGAREPVLLLSGGIRPDGQAFLNPAFATEAPAKLADATGNHVLTGWDARGGELFSLRFAMSEVSDYDTGAQFAFALPARPEWAGALDRISLSGPGGVSVTLDATSDHPMAIVIDRRTRQVRAILRDAQAAPAAVEGAEVLFSRGIPALEAWEFLRR